MREAPTTDRTKPVCPFGMLRHSLSPPPPRFPSGKVGLLPESRRETNRPLSYRLSGAIIDAHANFHACGMHHSTKFTSTTFGVGGGVGTYLGTWGGRVGKQHVQCLLASGLPLLLVGCALHFTSQGPKSAAGCYQA